MSIIAIGGGKLPRRETFSIDQHAVEKTQKSTPNALFIPTASYDDEEYWRDFKTIYGEELDCHTEVLYLLNDPPAHPVIKTRIQQADLIYVGGGNTLKMMRRWRHLGVAPLLKKAYAQGTVCCGVSAGALCWFLYGHSDSMFYYHPQQDWDYIRVRGLGLVPLTLCPHYDGEKRDHSFQQMIKKNGHVGVALDDNCALEIEDDQYRILTSQESAQAYKVIRKKGKVYQEAIPQSKHFRSLKELTHPEALIPNDSTPVE
jgi:dipeptidase E